jgi:hypothetical protein
MSVKPLVVALSLVTLSATPAAAGPISMSDLFGLSFAASQSLWAGGPNAGLDSSARTSGNVGLYYHVQANSGTVNATQNGNLTANYLSEVAAGSPTTIGLRFAGAANGGLVEALFGASASTGVFLDIAGCIGIVTTFGCGGVSYNIDTDIAIIDEGFFLDPRTMHTPTIDTQRTATDADQAFGVGVGPSIGTFHLGPSMNLDLEQRIFFTPTGVSGMACYEHRDTHATGCAPFVIPTNAQASLQLSLGVGTWDISFVNVALLNSFRNDIDLELRPSFDYLVGSWPPVGQELFAFGLIDETFSLGFNTVARAGDITVTVVEPEAAVPEPTTLLLFGSGLAAAARWGRATDKSQRTTNK